MKEQVQSGSIWTPNANDRKTCQGIFYQYNKHQIVISYIRAKARNSGAGVNSIKYLPQYLTGTSVLSLTRRMIESEHTTLN